jgi:hypothetical protein
MKSIALHFDNSFPTRDDHLAQAFAPPPPPPSLPAYFSILKIQNNSDYVYRLAASNALPLTHNTHARASTHTHTVTHTHIHTHTQVTFTYTHTNTNTHTQSHSFTHSILFYSQYARSHPSLCQEVSQCLLITSAKLVVTGKPWMRRIRFSFQCH